MRPLRLRQQQCRDPGPLALMVGLIGLGLIPRLNHFPFCGFCQAWKYARNMLLIVFCEEQKTLMIFVCSKMPVVLFVIQILATLVRQYDHFIY